VPLAAGDLIADRYRLDRRLATGGSADVWLALDERLDRHVAVKVLQSRLLPDEASRSRFAAESRATAALSHPAIVPVHDVIEDETHPAIVLRYIEGPTLAELLQREGPVSVKAAAEIGAALAGALAHAHRAGIVHLDLKPGNVLVDPHRHVQLVDFGIARSVGAGPEVEDGELDGPRQPRQVIGTLRYMAPEQLAGGEVDSRSDLFALGLVLHELLTGRPAYATADPTELVAAQRAGPPPLPASTPPDLTAVIRELLAVDLADRPRDAAEVEARLRAIAASATDQPLAAAPGAVPTIVPGLPAASAGLAFVAPAGLDLGPDSDQPAAKEPVADARVAGPPVADLDATSRSQDLHDPNLETVAVIAPPTARVAAPAPALTRPPRPVEPRAPRVARPAILAAAGAAVVGGIVLAMAVTSPGDQGAAALASASPDAVRSPAPTAKPRTTAAPAPVIRVEPARPHPKHHGHGKGHD
jgi:serine/threonine protein kinase